MIDNLPNEGIEGDVNIFDEPMEVQSELNDELIKYDNFLQNDEAPEASEEDELPVGQINFDNQEEDSVEQKTDSPENIDFEDREAQPEDDKEVFKEEDAIERLKALGYNVSKDENLSEDVIKTNRISEIDKATKNLTDFLNQDDMVLCRQKVIEDVTAEFKKRGENPAGEEFDLEVQSQLQEYEYNPRMAKLEASNIRRDVQNYMDGLTKEKESIITEIEEKRNEEIKKSRISLQKSFQGYNGKTLFGQRLGPDVLKKAYSRIVGGDFAKSVNSDQNIQAELALYLELRDILSQSKGATYGEGVAAAVNAINGNGNRTQQSSLNKTVSRPAAGNSINDRIAKWSKQSKPAT